MNRTTFIPPITGPATPSAVPAWDDNAAQDLDYTREVRHEALHLALDFHANVASPVDSASSVITTASAFESYLRGE